MNVAARVVPRDDVLPAMGELLATPVPPTPIGETLSDWPTEEAAGEHGEIRYVRYRPGRDCTVLWSFPSEGRRPLLISARLFSDSRGLVVQAFPRDHRLQGLELASSEAWVAERLTALGLGGGTAMPVVEVLPNSYKPGIRCVLRYSTGDADRRLLCLAKVARDDEPPQPILGIGQLATRLRATGAPWDIAAPIAHVPEVNLSLIEPIQEAVPVSALIDDAADGLIGPIQLEDVVKRTADGLGWFQRSSLMGLPTVDPAARLIELERKVSRAGTVEPELASWMSAPLASLKRLLADLPPERPVLSHGSFRHEHLLVDDARLVAVDLDNLCIAGASADAGSFLAFLDVEAVADDRRRAVTDACVDTFVSALSRGGCFNPSWAAWYRAAGHLKWALRHFFSLSPRWPEAAEALSQLATDTLGDVRPSATRQKAY